MLGRCLHRNSCSPCSGSLILRFEVFFVGARSGTVQGPILDPFWVPFWLQKSIKISQKAAKRDFGASQEGRTGNQKGIQKWVPKKITVKSLKKAPDGSDGRSTRGRRATGVRSARLLLNFSAARGGKEGNKQAYNPLQGLLARGK